MTDEQSQIPPCPTPEQIRLAVDVYLHLAYPGGTPARLAGRLPPAGAFAPQAWLMTDAAERSPDSGEFALVRSFALRLGNVLYPNMKLRLSRPPAEDVLLLSVDSHDGFLQAPAGSADHTELESLKQHNAAIVSAVNAEWDRMNLPTERTYLRQKIRQARNRQV